MSQASHLSYRAGGGGAVTRRAALLVIGVLAVQLAFIASYLGAFHRPQPHRADLAVVAPAQVRGELVRKLDGLPGRPLDAAPVPDEATAVHRIRHRESDAALVVDPRGTRDRLLVAGGAGGSLAQAVEQVVTRAERAERRSVTTTDIVPAGRGDARALSAFYLVVGWCVGGYLCAAVLAISAGARAATPRRATVRLGVLALYSVVSGLGGVIIVNPVLDALGGNFFALWGLGTLVVFAVGAATLALQGFLGVVGIGVAILLVVVLGNPSAGGAYPYPLLPGFWRTIGPALPPGAGVWTARSIAYFRGNAVTGPLLVLSAWAVAGTVLTLVSSMLRGHTHQGPELIPRAPDGPYA
ncbi:DUF3533 domain-containing protein [Streptomyces pactum]|uniref:DUF3533 domain-containing protein n=1 Tax=Streptomyces pactum TaxID=68249 RepID=A0ABS0NG20_9ACTN|nr:DUF3533 domain-containing protein [Streptomyces pactum]MBH5334137.1 DUF3533 domain-containing protein [Streptomyces pactum]